jgi:flavin-dependent dehydrogenase
VHDVLIAGAGVAGSTTALRLARAGVRVLLLDRATFPRSKVCGEGILPGGVAELQSLDLLSRLEPYGARIDRLRFSLDADHAECALSPSGAYGLGVQRSILDEALLRAAAEAGAEVSTGVTVDALLPDDGRKAYRGLSTSAGDVEARLAIAADGLRSRMRRRAGLDPAVGRRRYGASAHFELEQSPEPRVDVYFRGGYEIYITPVGGRAVNIGLLCNEGVARGFGGDLEGRFGGLVQDALPRLPLRALSPPELTGPFPVTAMRAWDRNLLLAGDAAGFFDGISGEGISLALRSSRYTAEAALSYLETGSNDSFRAYGRRMQDLRRPSTFFARLILALAARPALARVALRNLAHRPDVFSRLAAVNSGELRFRDLRPGDLLGLLAGR